jgi:hypothetical protein
LVTDGEIWLIGLQNASAAFMGSVFRRLLKQCLSSAVGWWERCGNTIHALSWCLERRRPGVPLRNHPYRNHTCYSCPVISFHCTPWETSWVCCLLAASCHSGSRHPLFGSQKKKCVQHLPGTQNQTAVLGSCYSMLLHKEFASTAELLSLCLV